MQCRDLFLAIDLDPSRRHIASLRAQRMKIRRIKIDQLFDIFDYDIPFGENENVKILTGPNGYGKTMVLNIIFNLFNRKFLFFQRLIFERIEICLEDQICIEISRKNQEEKSDVRIVFREYGKIFEEVEISSKVHAEFEQKIKRYLPIRKIDDERYLDQMEDTIVSLEELLDKYSDRIPELSIDRIHEVKSKEANAVLDSINVHLIREQRLFRKVKAPERKFRDERDETIMTETIQTYAIELKQSISQYSQRSFVTSQELDSSFPDRLINEKNLLSAIEYDRRFNLLKLKQEKLAKFGLYEGTQKLLRYSPEDAKALLVYLEDLEKKLGVFDILLEKLELFTDILNQRRFTFKSIKISREKGFYFETSKGKALGLTQLSSGEQHEVVLLYELIFNAKQDVLVLVDEPEISLHVTWQKKFLDDLLRIIEIQKFHVLIATHSPSIINNRWDLVYNLKEAGKP